MKILLLLMILSTTQLHAQYEGLNTWATDSLCTHDWHRAPLVEGWGGRPILMVHAAGCH